MEAIAEANFNGSGYGRVIEVFGQEVDGFFVDWTAASLSGGGQRGRGWSGWRAVGGAVGRWGGGGWLEPEGGIGDAEHVFAFTGGDVDGGVHAGFELQIGIIDGDDGVIIDHVFLLDRGIAHLHDFAVKIIGIGVDVKAHGLAERELADVGFRDFGIDLHLGQVVGHDEEFRGIKAGGDSLADFGGTIDDHAVDGGEDRASIEVDFCFFDAGFGELDGGFGLGEVGPGFVVIGLGEELAFQQQGFAF